MASNYKLLSKITYILVPKTVELLDDYLDGVLLLFFQLKMGMFADGNQIKDEKLIPGLSPQKIRAPYISPSTEFPKNNFSERYPIYCACKEQKKLSRKIILVL